jgi:hypothetical protein
VAIRRYASQGDTNDKKINVGRRITPLEDMYEGTELWNRTDPITTAVIDAYNRGELPTGSGGKWDAINTGIIGLKNAVYEDKKSNPPPPPSGGNKNQGLINALIGYTKNIGDNSGPMGQLQNIYDRLIAEIGTQSKTGRADINRSTEQALAALNTQTNPYANLSMADIPAVTDPMSAYSQAVGAPTGGIEALQQMLQSDNAATASGFSNLAQLLGASETATQQSRIADVRNARTQALQDLAQNQRTSNLSALQSLLSGQQGQQQTTRSRQDQLMETLLDLAGKGIDVTQIMALLGGQ